MLERVHPAERPYPVETVALCHIHFLHSTVKMTPRGKHSQITCIQVDCPAHLPFCISEVTKQLYHYRTRLRLNSCFTLDILRAHVKYL